MARERATLQVGAPAQRRSAAPEEEEQLPEWWNPTPALHVSLYYKEEVRSPWPQGSSGGMTCQFVCLYDRQHSYSVARNHACV